MMLKYIFPGIKAIESAILGSYPKFTIRGECQPVDNVVCYTIGIMIVVHIPDKVPGISFILIYAALRSSPYIAIMILDNIGDHIIANAVFIL